MTSDSLPFGLSVGRKQASGGYRYTEQYEWQHLALRQREQATREQPHIGSAMKYPLHAYHRVEESVAAIEIPPQVRGHDLHSNGETCNDRSCSHSYTETEMKDLVAFSHGNAETEKNFVICDQPLNSTRLLESKQHSYPFGNKIGGYHGQGHACPRHSSKQGEYNLSPGLAQTSCQWTEGEPSLDHLCDSAKRADGYMRATERQGEFFSANQGSGSKNTNYQEGRHLPAEANFPSVPFPMIDKAGHRSYMENVHTYDKRDGYCSKDPMFNISDHTSVGRTCHRVEVGRAHTRKGFDEFATHHEQFHQSPRDNFRDHMGSSRSCRSTHKCKMSRKQCAKQDLQKKNSNSTFVGRHGRNSNRKRHGDHLDGQRVKRNMPSEDLSKELCYPKMKDWQSYSHVDERHSGSDALRNDNQEGQTKKIKKGGQIGEKGNYHPKKGIITTAVCSGSESNENSGSGMLNPKCRNKTIVSSNGPKQSEGSNNIKLESDKKPSLVVCTKNLDGIKSKEVFDSKLHQASVTHVEKGVLMKESENTSPSELLRECLIIWRRLKKDNCAEAENIIQTNTNGSVKTSKISFSGRLGNQRPTNSGIDDENSSTSRSAYVSSESDDESNSPSDNSKRCRGVMSSCELQKCSKERAGRESEQPFQSLRGNNYMKSPKYIIADASHPESSVCQKVSQHGEITDHLDANSKNELIVGYGTEKTLVADCAQLGERITSLSAIPELLDKKVVALCSMHDDSLKVNVSECSNQDSEISQFSATKLDKGTTDTLLEKPVTLSMGSDCRDIQWDGKDYNILRIKQEHSQHADSEHDMHHKESEEGPSQALKVASNKQIPHQFVSDPENPCTTRQADWNSFSSIPDLNCLPSTNADEERRPFEKVTFQVDGEGTDTQNDIKSLSASSCEPTLQKEQFKQREANELTQGICERECANRFHSPNSHSGPSQQSIVEENSMSIDAFKIVLCEFIKNIMKPLWEDGLLSREVHKIIARKAVDKVITVLAAKVPLTEIATCRFLLDESQSLEKLVQGYLDVYVGREVLKKKHAQ
ncbi:uncharacterized protein LOC102720418 [Oryza brachyantha]|uniref:uncharacterized protein LOC102720418 n=1 Tax=Oryza brachyantha TaxID=4533 RepID=UPI0007762DDA|nr:uncharacterized protein LOC102720418 [Oryza brachyantha]XP_015690463.1 uncharacterized protein LOC102720418 [Oryza brachyantha]XP_015690464.1 uncharacterized protein LOC102720418 [Oryza brachyantha]XP_015690465.1 uncharacterized protein LOC102720418 [Oryza brachyantha]XP_040378283.1 uncharacterized protein LOC102720418 [Oryza brachyantha]